MNIQDAVTIRVEQSDLEVIGPGRREVDKGFDVFECRILSDVNDEFGVTDSREDRAVSRLVTVVSQTDLDVTGARTAGAVQNIVVGAETDGVDVRLASLQFQRHRYVEIENAGVFLPFYSHLRRRLLNTMMTVAVSFS